MTSAGRRRYQRSESTRRTALKTPRLKNVNVAHQKPIVIMMNTTIVAVRIKGLVKRNATRRSQRHVRNTINSKINIGSINAIKKT